MVAQNSSLAIGRYVFGAGIVALALVCMAWGQFDPGQPVSQAVAGRPSLAYAIAAFMLAAGAALEWRRSVPWGAATLALYYTVVVVVVMNGRVLLAHPREYGAYSGTAEQLALAAAAVVLYAANARMDAARAARLTRVGQLAFAVCALLFGGAHFFYMNLTAPLVPKWLPPSQVFWAWVTGMGHIAAGVAILTGIKARLAAVLLTAMFASFTPLVHLPMLLGDPFSRTNWSESALNLALTGAAWVVADSLVRAGRRESGRAAAGQP